MLLCRDKTKYQTYWINMKFMLLFFSFALPCLALPSVFNAIQRIQHLFSARKTYHLFLKSLKQYKPNQTNARTHARTKQNHNHKSAIYDGATMIYKAIKINNRKIFISPYDLMVLFLLLFLVAAAVAIDIVTLSSSSSSSSLLLS